MMKRELSKIAIGLVGLAVQFLPAQAWAGKDCCVIKANRDKFCKYDCPDGSDCVFTPIAGGGYSISCP